MGTTTDLWPLGLARARPVDSPIISAAATASALHDHGYYCPSRVPANARVVIVRAPGAAWTGRGLGGLIEARLARRAMVPGVATVSGAYPIGRAGLGHRPVRRALTALVAVAIVGAGAAPHTTAEACDPAWIDYQP